MTLNMLAWGNFGSWKVRKKRRREGSHGVPGQKNRKKRGDHSTSGGAGEKGRKGPLPRDNRKYTGSDPFYLGRKEEKVLQRETAIPGGGEKGSDINRNR